MAKHTLSLEVLDTLNTGIFRVIDTSVYALGMTPDCPTLNITLPGFNYSVQFSVAPGFNSNLTACDFQIQTEDCGTVFKGLPDGVYVIQYSVSPKETVYVEYNYLRVSSLMNRYQRILCELDLSACAPDSELAKKLESLRQIKMYIEAAKAKVEVCHEPLKGMELYTYAKKLLGKFNCHSCH